MSSSEVISYLQEQLKNHPYFEDLNDNQEYQEANDQLRKLQIKISNIRTTNENNSKICAVIQNQIKLLQGDSAIITPLD